MNRFLLICLVSFIFGACNTPATEAGVEASKRSYVDLAGIDSSVKPGDNFFRYVNGKWYDTVKIADDQVGIGSYSFLNIPQQQLLLHILDSVSRE